MDELKTFGFDKQGRKQHLIAFRLGDLDYAKLLKLFETLRVQPRKDNITNRMTLLIDRVSNLLVEHQQLEHERRSYTGKVIKIEEEKKKLTKDIEALVSKALEHEPKETRPKPEPIPVTTKPPVIKQDAKTLLVKHGLIENRTPKCAKGHEYLSPKECDPCAYNRYCNYSSANTHFISHDAA